MRFMAILVVVLSSSFLCAQTPSPKTSTEPPLATLTAMPDKTVFKMGERIGVTLTLQAGAQGAFVSKWIMQDCSHDREWRGYGCGHHCGNRSGFDVGVYTLAGKYALTTSHGCVIDSGEPRPSPEQVFQNDFVFLQPAEEVKWYNGVDGRQPNEPGDLRGHRGGTSLTTRALT